MYYYFKFGKIKSANNDCLTFMFPQTCIILNTSPYQNDNYIPQQPSGGVLDNNKVIIY